MALGIIRVATLDHKAGKIDNEYLRILRTSPERAQRFLIPGQTKGVLNRLFCDIQAFLKTVTVAAKRAFDSVFTVLFTPPPGQLFRAQC